MKSSLAAIAVFLVAAAFWSQSEARHDPSFCCMEHQVTPVPARKLASFEYTNSRCPVPSIIFYTVKNRLICADPQAPWTQDRIRYLRAKNNGSS